MPVIYYPDRTETAADASASLLKRAQQRGQVRMIVGLRNVDIDPTVEGASPQGGAEANGADAEVTEALTLGPAEHARLRMAQNALIADLTAPVAAPPSGGAVLAAPVVRAVTRFNTIPFVALSGNATVVRRLLDHPQVASVQEDVPVPPLLAQSVPLIGADRAAASGVTGKGQVVAVLDTGVAQSHPMLDDKVVSEACYSTRTESSTSLCPQGVAASTAPRSGLNCAGGISGCDHGTHVAAIAVGNSPALKGVAPGAGLISIKVFSRFVNAADCGSLPAPCALAFWSDITSGLERVFALRSKFDIASVNLSLGGGLYMNACGGSLPAITAVINNLRSARIATVVASGNNGASGAISAPGCIASAVTVGSTTKNDTISWFSNHAALVDLMAPGSEIEAAVPVDELAMKSGTSMAAPHVAGAWAVMREAKPSASVAEVQSALACTGKAVSRGEISKSRIQLVPALRVLRSAAAGCS